jgi:hypothetical protein
MTLSARFAVTRSRKLFVASILLAGGYGLALFLSGLNDLMVRPTGDGGLLATSDRGLLARLKRLVSDPPPELGAGRLVPEPQVVVRESNEPTWLAATPRTIDVATTVGQPNAAEADRLATTHPAPSAPILEPEFSRMPPRPTARITSVTTNSAVRVPNSSSSWDRWPRWEPKDARGTEGAVAASHRNFEPTGPKAVAASYNEVNEPRAADRDAARTHVLVDGDSLALLADRYLDDPELADEIFRLNRDVLTSPDVLPIGVELRIPDGRMAESHRNWPSSRAAHGERASAPAGMVPVEWAPRTLENVPRAELLRPIPMSESD